VTDADDWLFNAKIYLKYSKAEDWSVLPVDDRVADRIWSMQANAHNFDFVFMDAGIRPPWAHHAAA